MIPVMATSLLDQHLTGLRRRVQQVLITRGMSRLAIVVVGAVLVECFADWLFHFDDPMVRLIFGLTIVGGAVAIARRHLVTPLQSPLSDVDLALRIEGRYPGFQDSLASTVQFVRSGTDPRIGSPQLQQAVVATTLGRLEHLDSSDIVNTRAVRPEAIIAAALCGAAFLLAAIDRHLAAIAVQRLMIPFSAPTWPRETNLRLLNADLSPIAVDPEHPLAIVRGESLKILVENSSGRLPARVTLEHRSTDRKIITEALRPTTMTDHSGKQRELAVGQLQPGKGDVELRAVGGDDDVMPWLTVRVVPPPAVEKLQVALVPPAYAKRKPERMPEGIGHIQGLIGTRVEIAAATNKPIASAVLRVKDREIPGVKLGGEGRRLSASFVIEAADVHSWWLELEDTEGFRDAEPPRYEVRGLLDVEPEISIDVPAADLQATADATVRIRTTARDDLGIKEIRLVYQVKLAEPGQVAPAEAGVEQAIPLFSGDNRPQTLSAEHLWKLAELKLQPGSIVQFHTEATDDFNLTDEMAPNPAPPLHVGRSVVRTLTVVSPEEKAREISQRQEGLLADLERAHKLEQQAHEQVNDLVAQLKNADKLRPEDLDTLQRTELGQRDVASQLADSRSGIASRAQELADELHNNEINDQQSERRLKRFAEELARLRDAHLAPIEQELTEARKLAQSPGGRPEAALRQAAENQAAVLESTAEILSDLSQWRGEHDAARELADIARQQADLNRRSAEIARQTLTKSAEDLSPQDRADLAKIAERQKREAEQLEQLESRMRATVESLSQDDPGAAAALQDAVDHSRDEGIAGRMRDAAGQIAENRMGQAARAQQEILEKLRELEDVLRHNRESDTEMLVKKLNQAEDELQSLRDRQAELLSQTRDAQNETDLPKRHAERERLEREQKQLQEETARLARRLARLDARKAGASAERAASRMQQAGDELEEDGDQPAAGAQQQEAVDDLEQAQRELARRRREEEETLVRERLARVADELSGMIPRQQGAIDETRRLDELHESAGKWSRAQLGSLRDLSKAQQALADEAGRIADKLAAAEVFALALKGVVGQMQMSAERLAQRETGKPTQEAQETTRRRLVDLVEALKPEQPGPNGGQAAAGGQEGGGGQDDKQPTDGIPGVAQIKLLVALQRELLTRTTRLDGLRDKAGQLPEAARAELEKIADEQGQLADLLRNLTLSAASNDEEDERPAERKEKAE